MGLSRAGSAYEAVLEARLGTIPLRRLGTIDDVGRSVAFLASPQADYITGQSLSLDGGATRWVHG
ncbi:MAG TPA: SDR family oxidoreductase [Candidatus Thermoplasmatota archaeon]|nr:SDR family oxidoreductase [Candidatus Thermoplasmatota archaeon]